MDKYVNSPTDVSGTLIWQGAVAPGLYLLSISASDTQGAYVIVQVPIIVGVDITPPTTPVVTANSFSRSTSQLYSSWTSSDTESGVSEYMYQIRQDSATGIVIRDWTSTQNYNYVTAGALSLINGKRYYFCVKAKNGVGLWSGIGYSNGITVDTTPPSKPTVGDAGNYTTSASKLSASWGAYDSISGIAEYQYQILQDSITGAIIKDWTSTGTVRSVALTGLTLKNGKTYYFSVKAKNGAGLWSEVGFSNGIKVDTTAPMTPRVGGEYVAATKALVGSWYSEDAESGIAAYQFRITQNSPTGIVIKGWTSVGTETGYMVTGLNLIPGKSYYFSVKAKNGAGTWSAVGYSNGITVS
ncbi:MAG: hypothetical protein HZB36_07400 [Candidatus Omnitrophica bacterium]|nr:hypothetical protein [Candidatus Omnitrophota bacterium]